MNGNTPAERARELHKILKRIYDPYGDESNVIDMLTDLTHLCATKRWDFDNCLRIARDHTTYEQREGELS